MLAVYRAKSVDEALKVCVDVNHAGGLGHTAVIFSRNDEIIRKFGEVMNAGRIMVNSPGSIGAVGGVYNDLVPTFSFGCGTGGGNSTTDNVNIYHYLNIKRVARRTQAPYVVPRSQSDLLQYERGGECCASSHRAPPSSSPIRLWSRWATSTLSGAIIPPQTPLHVSVIPEAEPEVKVVMQGVEALNLLQSGPDHRAGRRVRDRCGQDHEAQVRIAGG